MTTPLLTLVSAPPVAQAASSNTGTDAGAEFAEIFAQALTAEASPPAPGALPAEIANPETMLEQPDSPEATTPTFASIVATPAKAVVDEPPAQLRAEPAEAGVDAPPALSGEPNTEQPVAATPVPAQVEPVLSGADQAVAAASVAVPAKADVLTTAESDTDLVEPATQSQAIAPSGKPSTEAGSDRSTGVAAPTTTAAAAAAAAAAATPAPTAALVAPVAAPHPAPAATPAATTLDSAAVVEPTAVASPVQTASTQQPTQAAAPTPASAPAAPNPALSAQLARPVFSLAAAGDGTHTMTVNVTPEELGPVTVRAHITGQDIRIELFAPSDVGRDAIRQIIGDLRRDIASSGANVNVDVSTDDHPASDSARDDAKRASTRSEPNVPGNAATDAESPHIARRGTDSALDVLA